MSVEVSVNDPPLILIEAETKSSPVQVCEAVVVPPLSTTMVKVKESPIDVPGRPVSDTVSVQLKLNGAACICPGAAHITAAHTAAKKTLRMNSISPAPCGYRNA